MLLSHMSDLHFSPANLEESRRCMVAAVGDAISIGVDIAVLSGDATDHALPMQAPAIHALAEQVRRLSDHCPVIMLQGTFSHEPPGSLNLFRLLGGKHPIYVADAIEQVALLDDGTWRGSGEWRFGVLPDPPIRALFSCIPTVNKAQVSAVAGGVDAGHEVGEHLARVLAGLGAINDAARVRGIPTIGIGHGTVNGCESEHGVPMVALDHEFSVGALFAARADAFMLGHIHKHQKWERDGRVIAYAGSIGRFHYGEPDEKGFLVWQLGCGAVRADLIETPARRTVDLAFAGAPDMAALATAVQSASLKGAYVRVRWTVGEEERDQVDRDAVLKLLACAADVKLEGRVIPVQRARAPGIAQQSSIEGKAVAWARATSVDPAPLRACIAQLMECSATDIAQAVLTARSGCDGADTAKSLRAVPANRLSGGALSQAA